MTRCAYCGDVATTEDHVIPQNLRGRMEGWREHTVPACGECNSLMSTYDPGHTVAERRAYVRDRLRERYADDLRASDWTEAELADLGPSLRRAVEARMRRKAIARERIAWAGRSRLRAQHNPCAYSEPSGFTCRGLAQRDSAFCWSHRPEWQRRVRAA